MTAIISIPPLMGAIPNLVRALPSTPVNSLGGGFATLLGDGIKTMEAKVSHADQLVRQFALDDSIPVHQVTYALEEARLSVELAMQVRTRLLEGYRDLMNMQL